MKKINVFGKEIDHELFHIAFEKQFDTELERLYAIDEYTKDFDFTLAFIDSRKHEYSIEEKAIFLFHIIDVAGIADEAEELGKRDFKFRIQELKLALEYESFDDLNFILNHFDDLEQNALEIALLITNSLLNIHFDEMSHFSKLENIAELVKR